MENREIGITEIGVILHREFEKVHIDKIHDVTIRMNRKLQLTYRFYASQNNPCLYLPLNWNGYTIHVDNSLDDNEIIFD